MTDHTGVGAARKLLAHIAPTPELLDNEGLADTPRRMFEALRELTSGYAIDPQKILERSFNEGDFDQVVCVRAMRFTSVCEHHVMPFTGVVDFAYLPGERIVGLSKIPRLVRALSRRLQVQERLTREIADEFERALSPRGVAVIVRAQHSCMSLRGVESTGEMVTSELRGSFRSSVEARSELFALLNR